MSKIESAEEMVHRVLKSRGLEWAANLTCLVEAIERRDAAIRAECADRGAELEKRPEAPDPELLETARVVLAAMFQSACSGTPWDHMTETAIRIARTLHAELELKS